jgi:sugar transferase (PEP-CTERM system associated)
LIRFLNAYFPSRTVFLGISEACLVTLAFVGAAVVRLGATDATVMLSYEQGLLKICVISVFFVTCMYYFDLYDSSILGNQREIHTRLVQVVGTVCVLLAILYYVYPPLELGRGIFLIGVFFVAMVLFLSRELFRVINSVPQLAARVLIFGEGPLAQLLTTEIVTRPELGMHIVGHVSGEHSGNSDPTGPNGAGVIETLTHRAESLQLSRIIVATGDRPGVIPVGEVLLLKSQGMLIQDATEVYEAITGKVPVESLRLSWFLFSPTGRDSRLVLIYERLASVLASVIGLVLSLPLIPFIVLAIKLSSPGPTLYRQKRVGRGCAIFVCYKFRTMHTDAEADTGPTWAADDDPRITSVGRFLRLARLDEIPQLWNVLKGDMNLVGPRPERPEFVDWLSREIPYYEFRHVVRPGVTGWAQVRYKYGNSIADAREKLQYDLFYIKHMSPGLDFLILFQTIKIVILGRGSK